MMRNAYNCDQSSFSLPLHEKLTPLHLELDPAARMRNHLAEDLLDRKMLFLMQVLKETLNFTTNCTNWFKLLHFSLIVVHIFFKEIGNIFSQGYRTVMKIPIPPFSVRTLFRIFSIPYNIISLCHHFSPFYFTGSMNIRASIATVMPTASRVPFVLHLPANCQHNCVNTWGSYYCTCRQGYKLQADGKTCVGKWMVPTAYKIIPHNTDCWRIFSRK